VVLTVTCLGEEVEAVWVRVRLVVEVQECGTWEVVCVRGRRLPEAFCVLRRVCVECQNLVAVCDQRWPEAFCALLVVRESHGGWPLAGATLQLW
jgi:hypothetical protein